MALEDGLHNPGVLTIVFSGMFGGFEDNVRRLHCNDLKRGVTEALYQEREHPVLKGRYHFMTEGAFPYSRDVADAYWVLLASGMPIGWETGGGGSTDFVESDILKHAQYLLGQGLVSPENYDFLQSIGLKIPVLEKRKKSQ